MKARFTPHLEANPQFASTGEDTYVGSVSVLNKHPLVNGGGEAMTFMGASGIVSRPWFERVRPAPSFGAHLFRAFDFSRYDWRKGILRPLFHPCASPVPHQTPHWA